LNWWKNAHPDEPMDDPYKNEEFVEKFRKTHVENIAQMRKKLKLDKKVNPIIIVGKDCKRENIWRNSLFSTYKSTRTQEGFMGGPMVLAGPTAGYIIGFAAAAYFCGSLYQNLKTKRLMPSASSLLAGFFSCIAGIIIIYLFGYVHLFGFLFSLFPGQTVSDIMLKTWKSGIEPFIIIDLLKILIIINVLELGKKRKWKL
ncbi:MAG: biotin transporter BioY, partial [Actinobacteria bacterium]|nr:biotin transporter BioY [Actinomycetota bacterium]